ncbi:MAG TPA: hypothetical protein VMR50_02510 [Myxococcota bacterium]|nr:hypothetical protein [Myxococcota bacterium]
MSPKSTRRALVACALLAFSLDGCKRGETPSSTTATPPVSSAAPFRVTGVEVGSLVDNDKRIAAPSQEFAPGDTIYASVASEGSAPEVALVARWTYQDGQVVNETKQVIAPSGPAATEFHIAKASGWPSGKYKVEVTANGAPAGSREFEVK